MWRSLKQKIGSSFVRHDYPQHDPGFLCVTRQKKGGDSQRALRKDGTFCKDPHGEDANCSGSKVSLGDHPFLWPGDACVAGSTYTPSRVPRSIRE